MNPSKQYACRSTRGEVYWYLQFILKCTLKNKADYYIEGWITGDVCDDARIATHDGRDLGGDEYMGINRKFLQLCCLCENYRNEMVRTKMKINLNFRGGKE